MRNKKEIEMSNGQHSSGFKYVFWGIFAMLFLAFAGQVMWGLCGGFRALPFLGCEPHGPMLIGPKGWLRLLLIMLPTAVFFLAWIAIVGTLVYRDAKKRGMDPYLWATVAAFIPFFLGVIIYLVVRSSNGRTTCAACGRPIQSDYKACPYCGHRSEILCPACGKPVARDWKVCPHCAHALGSAS
ncbi:MAG: zinc ribbon domain-containing protein [Chitinivibrionia bacterium]|nr:zinc ribbon domain-containing protein [Chitinivibrionia bacterium]